MFATSPSQYIVDPKLVPRAGIFWKPELQRTWRLLAAVLYRKVSLSGLVHWQDQDYTWLWEMTSSVFSLNLPFLHPHTIQSGLGITLILKRGSLFYSPLLKNNNKLEMIEETIQVKNSLVFFFPQTFSSLQTWSASTKDYKVRGSLCSHPVPHHLLAAWSFPHPNLGNSLGFYWIGYRLLKQL